jgi:hypothetical protein
VVVNKPRPERGVADYCDSEFSACGQQIGARWALDIEDEWRELRLKSGNGSNIARSAKGV